MAQFRTTPKTDGIVRSYRLPYNLVCPPPHLTHVKAVIVNLTVTVGIPYRPTYNVSVARNLLLWAIFEVRCRIWLG